MLRISLGSMGLFVFLFVCLFVFFFVFVFINSVSLVTFYEIRWFDLSWFTGRVSLTKHVTHYDSRGFPYYNLIALPRTGLKPIYALNTDQP